MPPPPASPIREHPRKGSSIGWWVSSMSLQHYKGVSFIYVTVDTFLWYLKFVSLHLSTSCCMATIIKIDHFFSYQKVCLYGVFSCHSPLRHQLVCLFEGTIWFVATMSRIGQLYLGTTDIMQQRPKQVPLIDIPVATSRDVLTYMRPNWDVTTMRQKWNIL